MSHISASSLSDARPSQGPSPERASSVLHRDLNVRANEIFDLEHRRICARTDRLFAWLMALQWLGGIVAAIVISPRSWEGAIDEVHIHVWSAILVGGAISSLPIALAIWRPGASSTRYVIASAQMLMSALLIHLTGGRIETHFHVFGSLAFLSFYRDWRVLVPATAVIALDHLIRGLVWPESVFGVANASQWRWAEHAAWVLLEDYFLVRSCLQSVSDMRATAERRAQLEITNEVVAAKVEEQTSEIAERENLFRSLTQSSPVGVFRTDADPMRIAFANDKCSSILTSSVEDICAFGWWHMVHPDDRDLVTRSWQDAARDRVDHIQEFRIALPEGATRWIRLSATPLPDELGYVGTIEDISDRREIENRETWLGRILEASSNEIYVFDAENLGFVQVNQGGRRNTGYSMEELRAMNPLDLKPGFTVETFTEMIQPLRDGVQDVVSFETTHRRRDGTCYPVEARLQLSSLFGQSVFVAMILDVSERRAAEEERARLTAAIDHAADAIMITDTRGTIEYVNPAFTRVTGYDPDDAVGQTPDLIRSEPQDPRFWTELREKITSDNTWSGQFANKRKDGSLFESEATVAAIIDPSGAITHYVEVMRDVTEQNALERQLSQAQKLESIGQMAAGIAHEINTPTQYVGDNTRFLNDAFQDLLSPLKKLAAITSDGNVAEIDDKVRADLAAAMEAADLDYLIEEIPRAIQQSVDGVERVTKIVRSMKEFSHPSQELSPTDLNRAIESTVTVARNEWKYVANLETTLDPNMGMISCFPGDINQAVLNMIVNAAHAVGDVVEGSGEKGKIHIRTRRTDDWAEIEIGDTGSGIPAEIVSRVFDPFFTTKEVGKGTGQGLSIAHKIITQKHKGELHVDSEVGVGTTFTIRLPLVTEASEEEVEA